MKTPQRATARGLLPHPSFLVLATGLALLAQMPPHWPAAAIETACAGRCRLGQVDGRWWSGHGELFARSPASENWLALGRLDWQLFPAAGGVAEIGLDRGRIVVHDFAELSIDRLLIPAEIVLGDRRLKLPTGDWQGQLEISRTTIRRQGLRPGASQGELIWHGAASSLLAGHPLGDYQVRWQWLPGEKLSATIGGGRPGAIDLTGSIAPLGGDGGQLHLRGRIALSGESSGELARYLRLIAAPDPAANGQYLIDRSTGQVSSY